MSQSKRPNFVLFCTDQQQASDLGALGNAHIQSPNLDRLIREGVIMRNSFSTHPVCTPARSSMFTGRYCNTMGFYLKAERPNSGLRLDENTVARELQRAGYHTAGVGKFHLHTCEVWGTEKDVTTEEYARRGQAIPENYFGFEHVRLSARHREIGNWEHASDVAKFAPEVFAQAGPANALAKPSGAWQSWKSAVPEEWYSTTWIANQAIDFLRNKRRPDDPFFLWCSFPNPHHPMAPPAPWCDMYDPAKVPMPRRRPGELADAPPWTTDFMPADRPEMTGVHHPSSEHGFIMPDAFVREIRALTYGMISLLDKHIGRVVDTLRETGQLDNTIIVYICDHGDYLGDHWLMGKGPLHYDSIIRVPNFWWAPAGWFAGGRSVAELVSQVDLMPTVLDLAGVPVPAQQGRSLRPLLEGRTVPWRDAVLVECDGWKTACMPRTIRTKDFRMTRWLNKSDLTLNPVGELFDLRTDPDELHNVFTDPAYAQTKADLNERLLALQVEATCLR